MKIMYAIFVFQKTRFSENIQYDTITQKVFNITEWVFLNSSKILYSVLSHFFRMFDRNMFNKHFLIKINKNFLVAFILQEEVMLTFKQSCNHLLLSNLFYFINNFILIIFFRIIHHIGKIVYKCVCVCVYVCMCVCMCACAYVLDFLIFKPL